MKEVEVKILEVNRQKLTGALEGMGAKKVFDGEVTTVFLDFPDGQIGKRGDVLRIRRMQQKTEVTYKKIKAAQAVKEADETNLEVSDYDSALAILQCLGLTVTGQMQKHRVSYRLDGVHFDIDRYSSDYGFIPEFLEIEGTVENIHRYAGLLGYQPKDCLPWSTSQLVDYYFNKKHKQEKSG
ncbi:MAG: class IV adenylate cyclase [Candidatus Bathyarchaeota archaeon]|nr:class IV adenylate cyclase [Candidatus Bathyarchaeota archaeon]